VVLVSNDVALRAMAAAAAGRGYRASVVTPVLAGEARDVGLRLARELHGAGPGSALLYGGETTVTVAGRGRGGRNQEVALAASRELGDGEVVLALASDGRDNGDAARSRVSDSSSFLERTGDLLITGPTGANVADLIVALRR
jgi:glycerate 2-kinase